MKENFFTCIKAGRTPALCILTLSLIFSACSKNNDSDQNSAVTADEAVQVMAQAVDPQSGGLVLETEFTAGLSLTNSNPAFCGIKKDTTVAGQLSTTDRSFNYNLTWSRLLTCTGNTPSKFEHTFNGTASYSVPMMSSTGSAQGSFTITGLEPTSSQLTFEQTFTRNATQQYNVNTQHSFTSTVNITSTAVKIDKLTRQIVSGTANITINGTALTGGTFSYNGVLTFLGGRKASIAVNGASAYTVQW